jgi:hypothetical protein
MITEWLNKFHEEMLRHVFTGYLYYICFKNDRTCVNISVGEYACVKTEEKIIRRAVCVCHIDISSSNVHTFLADGETGSQSETQQVSVQTEALHFNLT